jgi:predicted TIM-barrel fold metal-dependent hydrolase
MGSHRPRSIAPMHERYLPNRRHALCCGAAAVAGLFTSLETRAAIPGLNNPCRGKLPDALTQHELVRAAFDGIDPHALWDVHAHLLGTGDSGSGCTVHPSMSQWWRPIEVLRRQAILNAACVPDDAASIDSAYRARLEALAADFPAGARWCLFAFDHAHRDDGGVDADATTFHVPDAYARNVAAASERFRWVASIHPYAPDALARLEQAIAGGAVAIKWLPSAMNIDPRDPRCRPFYDRLARARLPLVVHCGEEMAVPGAKRDAFGNPLLMRVPLESGVRVIVAHCASLGHALDTDKPSAPRVPAFDLFARLMDERAHEALLMGDLSAVFQINRKVGIARRLLEREDWQPRLLHGSDYPLPGIPVLTRPRRLADAGLLDAAAVPVLLSIREHNPLLFDFVLKRSLRLGGRGLTTPVFETRRHFAGIAR